MPSCAPQMDRAVRMMVREKEVGSGRERRTSKLGGRGAAGRDNPRGIQVGRRPGLRGAEEWDEVVEEVLRELGRDARRPGGTPPQSLQQPARACKATA